MLLMVLLTDIHQLRIVDIIVTLATVHIAIGQVHPELVTGGVGVLLHVAAPDQLEDSVNINGHMRRQYK